MPSLATRWLIFAAVAALPLLVILAPIGAFLVMSFGHAEKHEIIYDWTLTNYINFFGNWTYLSTFLGTLWLCLEVVLLSLLVGYPMAWYIWRQKSWKRYALLQLAALVNQGLLALGILEQPSQVFLYNQRAVLITMTVIYLPYVVLPIFLALERIPRSLLQASVDLGANGWDTFRRVVFPLSLPGTIAGALFAFVLALGDFITPQMVGGTTGFTIGRVIFSQFGLAYDWPFGSAMATILFLVALLLIIAAGYAASRRRV
jgi:spermidine/putrescine transport system permease protein